MGKKIKTPNVKSNSKISQEALQIKVSHDDEYARLTFSSSCDKHCKLSEWFGSELDLLMDYFKKIENMAWKDIKKDSGLNYESISSICLKRPSSLPPDSILDSMRVSGKMRVYGYRVREFFNIIWFDKNHIVCALDKERKYKI